MFTAIIILNYNNSEDTIKCIESVERYNSADVKYIVVDNGSTRQSVVTEISEYIKGKFSDSLVIKEGDPIPQHLPHVSFYVSSVNDGYAKGNNKGLNLAYADDTIDNVLILNSDILFVEDIIPKLKGTLVSLPNCAIVSPILYKKDLLGIDYNCARKNHKEWELILTYLFLYKDIFGIRSNYEAKRKMFVSNSSLTQNDLLPIELPSGSCMLMSKDLMSQIGGFDPRTFLYFEENILYKKIEKLGLQNYLLPKSKCIHLGATSTQKVSGAFLLQCSLDSASYYLTHYCNLTFIQKIVWNISKVLFSIKIKLIRLIK
ncbi:MAG: glycosyltransferase [Bacteroidales bacterium]|nr:glycosyltransferase [Bacteroidales bacterium]